MFDDALIVADNKIVTALNLAVLSKRALTPFYTKTTLKDGLGSTYQWFLVNQDGFRG